MASSAVERVPDKDEANGSTPLQPTGNFYRYKDEAFDLIPKPFQIVSKLNRAKKSWL